MEDLRDPEEMELDIDVALDAMPESDGLEDPLLVEEDEDM